MLDHDLHTKLKFYRPIDFMTKYLNGQGGGTLIDVVLCVATTVKEKVSSQDEIFSIVNSQATISF